MSRRSPLLHRNVANWHVLELSDFGVFADEILVSHDLLGVSKLTRVYIVLISRTAYFYLCTLVLVVHVIESIKSA